MLTRVLARLHQDESEWIALAYQAEAAFCTARGVSVTTGLSALRDDVQKNIALQARAWLKRAKQPGPDIMNCPEGAIRLPIDLWACKLTKEICPIQAQVFLDDRDRFVRHCQAPKERKEQIFDSVADGAYDGFHHVAHRYLCPSCEHEGKKMSFRYHYPWELTLLGAYYPFVYERDWPHVRAKLRNRTRGLTLVSSPLCATHCKELAEQIDPVLAAELMVIEFDLPR